MGRFESRILPQEECTAAICTQGRLIGSLSGEYEYIGAQLLPTGEATIPNVMFYTGFSTVHTLKGDLYLTDAGALDFGIGNMSALLTVTGGTGEYGNAGGYLHVFGAADMQSAFVAGSFEGIICREQ